MSHHRVFAGTNKYAISRRWQCYPDICKRFGNLWLLSLIQIILILGYGQVILWIDFARCDYPSNASTLAIQAVKDDQELNKSDESPNVASVGYIWTREPWVNGHRQKTGHFCSSNSHFQVIPCMIIQNWQRQQAYLRASAWSAAMYNGHITVFHWT